jgi:hypothetical protein
MSTSTDYTPPTSSSIKERQNDPDALRLLIAQRRFYRKAKRWLGLRWLGMVVIAITAPIVSVVWPSLAVAAGAVAGVWLFLGRTLLVLAQTSLTSRAAAVQEKFGFYVFEIPDHATRSTLPSLEEIAAVAGPDDQIAAVAEKERLLDWYPINANDSGSVAVAIAQRANAAYADSLLRTTAIAWAITIAVWTIVLVILTLMLDISVSAFLLGVALPVLPAYLDVVQYVGGVWHSAEDRRDLVREIEAHLSGDEGPVQTQNLLVWQERLFDLRRSAPEVPDFLYKVRRKVNERAMHTAADQLSRQTRESR